MYAIQAFSTFDTRAIVAAHTIFTVAAAVAACTGHTVSAYSSRMLVWNPMYFCKARTRIARGAILAAFTVVTTLIAILVLVWDSLGHGAQKLYL